jgi:hypothetical protein
MQKFLLILTLFIGLISCKHNPEQTASDKPVDTGSYVEVLCFHGKQRCATCQVMEQESKNVVDNNFASEVTAGKVVFRIVDINKEESLADKYEVTWSSLIVVGHKDGEEKVENMTEFAFANARNNTAEFRKELTAKINKLLD